MQQSIILRNVVLLSNAQLEVLNNGVKSILKEYSYLRLSLFFVHEKKTNHQLKKQRTGLPAVARSHLLPWPKFKLSNANELLPSWYLDWN